MSTSERWEHFPHEADIGIRGQGSAPARAFEQAALALTAVVTEPASVSATRPVELSCEAPDLELLFYCWINRVVWSMATERMLFAEYEVRIHGGRLDAVARGEPVDVLRHQPAVEPKGATFTELSVHQQDGCWVAQCVIDV